MMLCICEQRFLFDTILQFGYTLLTLYGKIFDSIQGQVIGSSISFCMRYGRCGFQLADYITISIV